MALSVKVFSDVLKSEIEWNYLLEDSSTMASKGQRRGIVR